MSDEKIPEPKDDSTDHSPSPTAEEDDPGKGFGVGESIASIISEVLDNADDPNESGSSDDPGEGFGTGGDVKAPRE